MRPAEAWRQGISRATRAPAVLVSVFLVTLAVSLPLSMALRSEIERHLGGSLVADRVAQGVDPHWWSEFSAGTGSVGQTFQTTIIGFAAVLDNLSAVADGDARPAPVVWLGAAYLIVWLFLTGGILDRYARARPTSVHEFFSACGVFFARFLRLAPMAAAAYYLLFAVFHPALFEGLYGALTRDVDVERTAFAARMSLYAVFGLLLAAVNVVFDYAKVRAVVEDRRSMIGALAAGARFVGRHAGAVSALYALNSGLFLAVLAGYALVAPGAEATGARFWLGFFATQAYLIARLWVKLVFLASETSLFQGRLAHAGYVARPPIARPEPPLVERIVAGQDSRM